MLFTFTDINVQAKAMTNEINVFEAVKSSV